MKLIIPQRMHDILSYLSQKPLEWSAIGEITEKRVEGGMEFTLDEIHFPEQVNSKAETDIAKDVMSIVGMDLRSKGVDTSKLKMWIHSHNTMGTTPSGTDDTTLDTKFKSKTYSLAMIVGSNSNWTARMALFNPVRMNVDLAIKINWQETPIEVLEKYKTDLESVEVFPQAKDFNKGGSWIPKQTLDELAEKPMTIEELNEYYDYIDCGYTVEAAKRNIVDMRHI